MSDKLKICSKCELLYSGNACKPCKAAYDAKRRIENREKVIQISKSSYNKHKLKYKKTRSQWYLKNLEKCKVDGAAWKKANPEIEKERQRRASSLRRAQQRACFGKLSKGLFQKLMKLQKSKCACCKSDLAKIKPHMDHIMPLALGGENTDSNIQLLCYVCNQSKHAKHPVEFMQSRGFLL